MERTKLDQNQFPAPPARPNPRDRLGAPDRKASRWLEGLLLHGETGEEEPWYLVSDQPGKGSLLKIYRKRMRVEEIYGDMKGHGFDMEFTHLKDTTRISRLVLGICIVLVLLITRAAG